MRLNKEINPSGCNKLQGSVVLFSPTFFLMFCQTKGPINVFANATFTQLAQIFIRAIENDVDWCSAVKAIEKAEVYWLLDVNLHLYH